MHVFIYTHNIGIDLFLLWEKGLSKTIDSFHK